VEPGERARAQEESQLREPLEGESQPGGKEKPAENLTAGSLGQAINPRWCYGTPEEEVGGSGNAKSRRSGSKVQAGLWENDKEESGWELSAKLARGATARRCRGAW
jgi:hypothetical protein